MNLLGSFVAVPQHKSLVGVIQLRLIICRLLLFVDNPIYDLPWPGASFAIPRLRRYKYSTCKMSYLAFVSLQSQTNNKSIKQKTTTKNKPFGRAKL